MPLPTIKLVSPTGHYTNIEWFQKSGSVTILTNSALIQTHMWYVTLSERIELKYEQILYEQP